MEELVKIKWRGTEAEVKLRRPSFFIRDKAAKAATKWRKTTDDKGKMVEVSYIDEVEFKEQLLKLCTLAVPEGFSIESDDLDFEDGDKLFKALSDLLKVTEEEQKK